MSDSVYHHMLNREISEQNKAIVELSEALKKAMDHVGHYDLPPEAGWPWYDALKKHAPHLLDPVEPTVKEKWTTYFNKCIATKPAPPECFEVRFTCPRLTVLLPRDSSVILCDETADEHAMEIWIQPGFGEKVGRQIILGLPGVDIPKDYTLVETYTRGDGFTRVPIYIGTV